MYLILSKVPYLLVKKPKKKNKGCVFAKLVACKIPGGDREQGGRNMMVYLSY